MVDAGALDVQDSEVVTPFDKQSYVTVVGACPARIYKSASPEPPDVEITRLLAPAGTTMENKALDPALPDRPDTGTPFCSVVTLLLAGLKVAPRLTAVVPAATVQPPVPAQAPLQPANVLPVSGVAVKVMLADVEKLPTDDGHAELQAMPLGLLVTVPRPVPDLVTVTCRVAEVEE